MKKNNLTFSRMVELANKAGTTLKSDAKSVLKAVSSILNDLSVTSDKGDLSPEYKDRVYDRLNGLMPKINDLDALDDNNLKLKSHYLDILDALKGYSKTDASKKTLASHLTTMINVIGKYRG